MADKGTDRVTIIHAIGDVINGALLRAWFIAALFVSPELTNIIVERLSG